MLEENLLKLGLSPSEVKIYLHLLETGSSYANKISFETVINRTNVYEALDRLIHRGLISSIIKNKKRWFEANEKRAVLSLIKNKQEELSATKKDLIKDVKTIKKSKDTHRLEATIFTGKNGLRNLFEEIVSQNSPIYLLASELQFPKIFGPYFELWHKQRIKNKIPQKSIFPIKLKEKLEKRNLVEYRFVGNKFANPTTTIIYGNNCIFIQWPKELFAIKINDKEIVKSHLNYFKQLWNSATK